MAMNLSAAQFRQGNLVNVDDAAIVRSIIVLAHSLRLEVIAEGVETVDQRESLRELGCDQFQGYYASRPLPLQHTPSKPRQASSRRKKSRYCLRVSIQRRDSCAMHWMIRRRYPGHADGVHLRVRA